MSGQNVPVVDCEQLPETATRRQIHEACLEWGFFQVMNHGISSRVLTTLRQEMSAFFALPRAVKRRVSRTAESPWGFYDRELTKNTRDWKQVFDYGPEAKPGIRNRWPIERPGLPEALRAFTVACEAIAFRLLGVIAANLGAAPEVLADSFRPEHSSFLRLNYYPACPAAAGATRPGASAPGRFGVHHHTDSGALTLLLQDEQPGLEVLHDGCWHLIEPRPDALVVNVGDIVQVWSNDRYRAAVHRVSVSPTQPRFSAPFFFNPAYSAHYAPLPSAIPYGEAPHYRAICWGDFRARRAAGDYEDRGEEVQIDHYRTEPRRRST